MRRLFTVFLLFIPTSIALAQTFGGYSTSPDAGIYGILTNPATAASTHFKWDVNIAGASAALGNTYAGFAKSALRTDSLKLGTDYFPDTTSNLYQFAWAQADILMPSVMYSIDETQSLAFTWRVRGAANWGPFSPRLLNFATVHFPNSQYIGQTLDMGHVAGTFNTWNEFGFTYARVLMESTFSRIKGGVTLKYLSGIASGYAIVSNTTLRLNSPTSMTIDGGHLVYGYTENLARESHPDEHYYNLGRYPGVGADIGFTWEWRPDSEGGDGADYGGNDYFNDDADAYRLRIGVSVTDIGGINYNNDLYNTSLNLDKPDIDPRLLNKSRGESYKHWSNRVKQYFTNDPVQRSSYYMQLPTALHLSADYQFGGGWALSGNAVFGLNTNAKTDFRNNMITIAQLTPRYEHGWWSAFLPMSVNRYQGVDVGMGLRLGPVILGSGSIFSDLASSHIKRADFFLAVRLPLGNSKQGKTREEKRAIRQVECAF
ncbi:hypothetical protein GA0116948_10491 [Chitinophaga costaii]|uniref:DUF5723 domain-containing protein n=1 Tax=Chitinophaga costaii TaxID=1335309 RepID=A0A1C4CEN5_9BACT|nr:DUF5723 family protein [Chitinophaga costaii]PUZ27117.1 hypothetical protein DCM91_07795 [Chitinophaga costaii]SCC17565.1 hypothetical protein GA0116948_10491 [Chitinophaga costaii]